MRARAKGPRPALRRAYKVVIALLGLAIAVYAVMSVLSGSGTEFLFSAWFGVFVLLFIFLVSLLSPWRLAFLAHGGWLGQLPPHNAADGVKEVLRQRYLRAEIGKDQYDQMMRDLDRHA